MKYRQFVAGFVLGLIFAYGGYRVIHHFERAGGLNAANFAIGQPVHAEDSNSNENELTLSKFELTPKVDLGQVTFEYDLVAANATDDAVMQLYLDVGGNWQQFTPSDADGTLVFHLQQSEDCTGKFAINLPKGSYTAYRILLFDCPDGKDGDYGHTIYDTTKDHNLSLPKIDIQVVDDSTPFGPPEVTIAPNPIEEVESNGLTTVTLPAQVTYASSYPVDGGGFWVMAKSAAGFCQVYASTKDAVPTSDTSSPGQQVSVNLVFKDVKPGIWNAQIGLFKPNWGSPLQWIDPGTYFEVGGDSWVKRANEALIPPRLKVADQKFELLTGAPYNFYKGNSAGGEAVKFLRGGNYGNAIIWTFQPALDTPEYFASLKQAGCQYVRFNYNPDEYLEQHVYRSSVDQIVQNIWSAGLYPLIAPQDLPEGATRDERIEKGDRLMKMVADRYSGRSIWLEVCNEPHEFGSWLDWKPVATRYVKTIRSIDPDAFVVVPFEYFSSDGNGAAKSPITTTHVDLYDGHAYIAPTAIAADFEPAIRAGLPVLIGEYGSADGNYLHSMDVGFQSLPTPPLAISPWAFTIKGQDTLAMVADASQSRLVFTAAGQAIANDFGAWDSGHKIE